MARATINSTVEQKLADPYYDWSQESGNPGTDIVRSARATSDQLGRRSVVGQVDADLTNRDIVARGPDHTYGDVARDTALGAAIPASFLGGPVGMAAGGGLALQSLKEALQNPSALGFGMAGLGLLPFMKLAKGAGKLAQTAKPLEVITDRTAMFDDIASRATGRSAQVESAVGSRAVRPVTNTAPTDAAVGGRLGRRGTSGKVEDVVEDALFETANQPGMRESLEALRRATQVVRPAASTADEIAAFTRQSPATFRRQTPELLEGVAADVAGGDVGSVAAPGFGLGAITPMSQVPTSKAKQAADAMAAMQSMTRPKMAPKLAPPPGRAAGFTDLTEDEIAAAMQSGYTYGQGLPETVRRLR